MTSVCILRANIFFALVLGLVSMGANSSQVYTYTSFQHGVTCETSQPPVRPSTLQEVKQLVHFALRNGLTVKALGRLHSATDIICTGGIPLEMHNVNHFSYNPITKMATVGTGLSVDSFLRQLHSLGRTIYGTPTFGGITVGGTLGTGAHGTGLIHPATISNQVVALIFVDGMGNIRNVTDRNTLRAFRTHLGLLGILYEVTFKTVPQYKLHIQNIPLPDSVLWKTNELLYQAAKTERFQMYWFPSQRSLVLSIGNRVPISQVGDCKTNFISGINYERATLISTMLEIMQATQNHLGYLAFQNMARMSLNRKILWWSTIFSYSNGDTLCNPAIGYSHKMSENTCKPCAWSHGNESVYTFEYGVVIPMSEFTPALNTMRIILQEFPADFPLMGIYFRFLSASDGLLSVNSDAISVAIDWALVQRKQRYEKPMMGLTTSQAMIQALVDKHRGRPHWGKPGLVFLHHEVISKAYPHLPAFIEKMKEFDPNGVFMNDFGRRLRFGSKRTSADQLTTHCALHDDCICKTENDCGDGKLGSFVCGTVQNYSVCKPRSMESIPLGEKIIRSFMTRGR